MEFARFGSEDRRDVVGVAAERVEELPIPGRAEVGDGGFHHVPRAEEFMPVEDILPAPIGFDLGSVGIQIAVRLLSGDDEVDVSVEFSGELFVLRILRECERHAFKHLRDVGVPEHMWTIRHSGFPGEAE